MIGQAARDGGRDLTGTRPCLTAIYVDYDNIYLSLRRKNEDAAKRFAKDAVVWLRAIESGRLIDPTNGPELTVPRRIVMNRCYGNPVPRKNQGESGTDMNSFPFVRHHFLRAGFEIVDCPPLTQQLKNSSDIRMVMDMRDYLHHDTYFDEFIIMSGDADFTPVLHRLRAHARRTIIFANDYTAAPYTAISDGEIREHSLIQLLLESRSNAEPEAALPAAVTRGIPAPKPAPQITTPAPAQRLAPPPAPMPVAMPTPQLVAAVHGGAPAVAVPLNAYAVAAPAQVPHAAAQAMLAAVSPAPAAPELFSAPQAINSTGPTNNPLMAAAIRSTAPRTDLGREQILSTIVEIVRAADGPVPIETLAERAVRQLGQERTAGSNWAGAGSFRSFLLQFLPADVRLSDQAPYVAYDTERHGAPDGRSSAPVPPPIAALAAMTQPLQQPALSRLARSQVEQGRAHAATLVPLSAAGFAEQAATPVGYPTHGVAAQQAQVLAQASAQTASPLAAPPPTASLAVVSQPWQQPPPRPEFRNETPPHVNAIQQAITRIYEACQAPPLAPVEYRLLFELMAIELTENQLAGTQTVSNVLQRALDQKLRVAFDDIRFVFGVVSEADPWFEKEKSAAVFASRFRNFVVARCRTHGLNLSADDIDLIDRLFTGGGQRLVQQAAPVPETWRSDIVPPLQTAETVYDDGGPADELPRFVRSGMRR